ncbi:ataxin-7-like protein 3 isoform X2 [Pomacea canaliculata]|uniref:ataxin-7-like protein 3 isoform X2 n=1 Tax=Pomacea canaliculata TaxID=400727 RepID=UPI000D73159B|nr:ataxin-7-like protein 3 isoform X2 [Pomacea canaliculata]
MVEADLSLMESEPDMQTTLDSIMQELIDEVSLGLCFEVHRSCKIGTFFLADTDKESAQKYCLIDKPGLDVLGQAPTKKNFECVCPSCQRHLAASRFAPHLEKCMGMGRNSSRIASRRIANNTKRDSDDSAGDDENDNDWNYPSENKKVKRLRREKGANSPRNRRAGRIKNGVAGHANAANGPTSSQESLESLPEVPVPNYENMTIEDRKALLLSTCGVISEHTKKMCTRSVRCPQHTDEQRRQVRHFLLRQNRHAPDIEDVHIDIDTCDDAETQSLRESLQWEASSNSSPADSTSTNNSTTSTNKRPAKNSKPGGGSKNKKQKMPSNKSNSSASSKDSASTSLYDFTS